MTCTFVYVCNCKHLQKCMVFFFFFMWNCGYVHVTHTCMQTLMLLCTYELVLCQIYTHTYMHIQRLYVKCTNAASSWSVMSCIMHAQFHVTCTDAHVNVVSRVCTAQKQNFLHAFWAHVCVCVFCCFICRSIASQYSSLWCKFVRRAAYTCVCPGMRVFAFR